VVGPSDGMLVAVRRLLFGWLWLAAWPSGCRTLLAWEMLRRERRQPLSQSWSLSWLPTASCRPESRTTTMVMTVVVHVTRVQASGTSRARARSAVRLDRVCQSRARPLASRPCFAKQRLARGGPTGPRLKDSVSHNDIFFFLLRVTRKGFITPDCLESLALVVVPSPGVG